MVGLGFGEGQVSGEGGKYQVTGHCRRAEPGLLCHNGREMRKASRVLLAEEALSSAKPVTRHGKRCHSLSLPCVLTPSPLHNEVQRRCVDHI